MTFMVAVHVRMTLRCNYGEGACSVEHVVFDRRLLAGERLPEPGLPDGWTAIRSGGTAWEVVLCPRHRLPAERP